jgi:hypothetical protein
VSLTQLLELRAEQKPGRANHYEARQIISAASRQLVNMLNRLGAEFFDLDGALASHSIAQ